MKFLTASWRDLVMCNWRVSPDLLYSYLPAGTVMDLYEGNAYLSLVAFRFINTKILGVPVPFHVNFDEINLRFYVKRDVEGELKRGVVFVHEFVPRFWIAAMARILYNENYFSGRTLSLIEDCTQYRSLSYQWGSRQKSSPESEPKSFLNSISVRASNHVLPMTKGSIEEFIAEHYFGYAKQRDGGTIEYRVSHPRWNIRAVTEVKLQGNFEEIYSQQFARILATPAESCFVAEGSEVEVNFGYRI